MSHPEGIDKRSDFLDSRLPVLDRQLNKLKLMKFFPRILDEWHLILYVDLYFLWVEELILIHIIVNWINTHKKDLGVPFSDKDLMLIVELEDLKLREIKPQFFHLYLLQNLASHRVPSGQMIFIV